MRRPIIEIGFQIARAHRNLAEPRRPDDAPGAALVQRHEHPLEQAPTQVGEAPPDHAVLHQLRSLANPVRQSHLFIRRRPGWRAAAERPSR